MASQSGRWPGRWFKRGSQWWSYWEGSWASPDRGKNQPEMLKYDQIRAQPENNNAPGAASASDATAMGQGSTRPACKEADARQASEGGAAATVRQGDARDIREGAAPPPDAEPASDMTSAPAAPVSGDHLPQSFVINDDSGGDTVSPTSPGLSKLE